MSKIPDAQKRLSDHNIDGWLFFDFRRSNSLAIEFLTISPDTTLSRRFFYWIPARGEPIKIVHAIEPHVLDHLPGKKVTHMSWQSLEQAVAEVLKGKKRILMEYSPRNAIPYVSKVDGGILDLVRSSGVEVLSCDLLQFYTAVLDEEQYQSHLEAADLLDRTAANVWDLISGTLQKGDSLTEFDVSAFMLKEFEQRGFVTDHAPFCCVNAHSADPHYDPTPEKSAVIRKGDFILIDLWCKKNTQRAVFADITRVAIADTKPSEKQHRVHQVVRHAQKAATEFIQKRVEAKKSVKGYEADQVARKVIEEAGFGRFFIHRTGHNIYMELHGPGAHLDSLETLDERELIPKTCFSVEPGIYLPGEFGVRQEYDVYIKPDHRIQITGGIQESITTLF